LVEIPPPPEGDRRTRRSPDGDRKAERDEAVGIGTDHPAPRHVHAAMHVPAAAPTEPTVAFRRRRLPPPLSPPHEGDPAKHGGGGLRRARVETRGRLALQRRWRVYALPVNILLRGKAGCGAAGDVAEGHRRADVDA